MLDKISILEIKLYKIKNKNSHNQVNKEYKILNKVKHSNIKLTTKIKKLIKEIKKVNLNLWNIEDKIRVHEKNKDFRLKFIKLARNVYLNNDKRAKIKSQINKISKSNINEIKQYIKY